MAHFGNTPTGDQISVLVLSQNILTPTFVEIRGVPDFCIQTFRRHHSGHVRVVVVSLDTFIVNYCRVQRGICTFLCVQNDPQFWTINSCEYEQEMVIYPLSEYTLPNMAICTLHVIEWIPGNGLFGLVQGDDCRIITQQWYLSAKISIINVSFLLESKHFHNAG